MRVNIREWRYNKLMKKENIQWKNWVNYLEYLDQALTDNKKASDQTTWRLPFMIFLTK